MDLRKIITNNADYDENLIVYAKKMDGKFLSSSDAVLLELTEDEQDMTIYEIAESKCPGFSYFLEMFLIKELMQDMNSAQPQKDIEQKIEAVIHYAEFDV